MVALSMTLFTMLTSAQTADVQRTGRYMQSENTFALSLRDPFSQVGSFSLTRAIKTRRDALTYLLMPRGYHLVATDATAQITQFLDGPLPSQFRKFDNTSIRTALNLIVGDDFFLVTDTVNYLAAIEPRVETLQRYRTTPVYPAATTSLAEPVPDAPMSVIITRPDNSPYLTVAAMSVCDNIRHLSISLLGVLTPRFVQQMCAPGQVGGQTDISRFVPYPDTYTPIQALVTYTSQHNIYAVYTPADPSANNAEPTLCLTPISNKEACL